MQAPREVEKRCYVSLKVSETGRGGAPTHGASDINKIKHEITAKCE